MALELVFRALILCGVHSVNIIWGDCWHLRRSTIFIFLAVVDLIFLVMLIIKEGLYYGIFINERPIWLYLIYPFGIHPMFYVFRFCTAYMLVVISIERFNVLSNSLAYKTKVTLISSWLYCAQLSYPST